MTAKLKFSESFLKVHPTKRENAFEKIEQYQFCYFSCTETPQNLCVYNICRRPSRGERYITNAWI